MSEPIKATAWRMYNAFNARDYAAVDGIFAPDFYSHPLQATGPSSVERAWRKFHESFPAVTMRVEDMIAENETVAVRTTVLGTSAPIPATMLEIFRVSGDRIVELWGLSSPERGR